MFAGPGSARGGAVSLTLRDALVSLSLYPVYAMVYALSVLDCALSGLRPAPPVGSERERRRAEPRDAKIGTCTLYLNRITVCRLGYYPHGPRGGWGRAGATNARQ